MSRALQVIQAIDDAERIRQHHPTLFAAQSRAGRSCLSLQRAIERHKQDRQAPSTWHAERDQVEPVDAQTAERFARDREEHDRGRRIRFANRRRDGRARLTTLDLVRTAIETAITISTVAAGNIEPSRGGNDPVGVPRQQMLEDDPRWQVAERIIRRQALVLHDLVDEARGLSGAVAVAALDSIEKDREILDAGVGLVAEDVVAALGREYGSATYVRRLRKREGLDTRGYPKDNSNERQS
jgi:hypothetical protein